MWVGELGNGDGEWGVGSGVLLAIYQGWEGVHVRGISGRGEF